MRDCSMCEGEEYISHGNRERERDRERERERAGNKVTYVLVDPPMHTSSTVHPTYTTVLGIQMHITW